MTVAGIKREAGQIPGYSWDESDIRPGGTAYTHDGFWTRRCWSADCGVMWKSRDFMPMFILEQAEHGATHEGVQVPGYNVGILA